MVEWTISGIVKKCLRMIWFMTESTNRKANKNSSEYALKFKYVFVGFSSTQTDIYNHTVQPLVQSVMDGFNGCIFAYGQTGTGKTFTMQGSASNPGIIPRTFEQIWEHINTCTENMQFLVSVSYVEIYLEYIK